MNQHGKPHENRSNGAPRGIDGYRPETFTGYGARWLGDDEALPDMDMSYDPDRGDGLIIGARNGKMVASVSDVHIITEAGSGAGKGVSCILTNLLSYRGSILCLDPKGENASITSRYRHEVLGQRVYVCDPYRITEPHCEPYRVGFNLMRRLTPDNPYIIEDAVTLADGLVVPDERDPHWGTAARNFGGRGLMIHTGIDDAPDLTGRRSLATVRDMMMLGRNLGTIEGKEYNGMDGLKLELEASPAYPVQFAAAEFFQKADKERDSVLSTLRTQTGWLDFPALRAQVSRDDFALEELRTAPEGCTIYLCLPVRYLAGSASRWMRAVVMDALRMIEETPTDRSKPPTLLQLDEAAILEPMKELQVSSSYLRGFHARVHWLFQTGSNQVKKDALGIYRSNAAVCQLFGNGNDLETLRWASAKCGKTTVVTRRSGEIGPEEMRRGKTGITASKETVDLITPDECARLFGRSAGKQLILTQEGRPAILDRIKYYDHPWFEGKFDDHQ